VIEREVHGDVAVLRLAHGKASALDLELLGALEAALLKESTSNERALVLTGSGSIFCAGVDLKRILEGGRAYIEQFLPALDRAFAALFFLEKPAVAAINGHAIAGGAVLALGCDRRILARGKALIGTPELQVGVPFPTLALEIVRAGVRADLHSEVFLVGRNFSGEEALARGLVDDLVGPESLLPRAVDAAAALLGGCAASFALTKRWLRRPTRQAWESEQAADRAAVVEAWCSKATLGAIEAYVARTLRKS
jgi:enoyl-CoA hydratase